ncbi:MAG: phosphatidate cytidylyltransferase [Rhizobiaceae bacterium]
MSQSTEGHRIFNQELKLRAVSAIVLAAAVLWMTWIGGQTFTLLWAVIAIAVFFEYSRICREALPFQTVIAGYAAILLVIGAWMTGQHLIAFWMAAVTCAVLLCWEIVVRRSFWASIGIVYALLPLFAMSELRGESHTGLFIIIMLFGCVWGADILAYFFGKSIGGPKLAPRISPKKTWSGFIGSLIGALGLTYLVCWFFGFGATFSFAVVILLLAVVSQIGDLIESVLKRKFHVKDSGALIPGHGGILDRIDGLIMAGVVLWIVLLVMRYSDGNDIALGDLFVNAFLMP